MISIQHNSDAPKAPAWDPEQLAVVTASPNARLIVTAGPGTGKTAVACGRVAHLVTERDVEPACVMLLSFTRTAVAEIKGRIAGYVGSEARAAGLKIATLDSSAWSFLSGLDPKSETMFGGYDANIDRLTEMLRDGDHDLLEYLERLEQFVVDEAQDVLGNRADLVAQLIRRLPSACGVTVFADACQSIYGFTNEDGEKGGAKPKSLLELLPSTGATGAFRHVKLSRLHRTAEQSLVKLLDATRPIVESAKADDRNDYKRLREKILSTAPSVEVNRTQLAQVARGRDDLMVLYRTRAEALMTASMLLEGDVPHRLRLSGLPSWLQPWIAVLLSDFEGDIIDEAAFCHRWSEKSCGTLPGSPDVLAAWRSCLGVAGQRGCIQLGQLRRVLARPRPPIDFCAADNGFTGPVVGTVHASKGREAEHVLFFLPHERDEDVAWDEESRVLYVGVTRARRTTKVAQGGATYSRFLEGADRPVRLQPTLGRAQFEVGRATDIDEFSAVSLRVHGDAASASRQQQALARSAAKTEKWVLRKSSASNWAYRLLPDGSEGAAFGEMSQAFGNHVFAIARILGKRSPMTIPHIRKIGVRTVAVSPDSPQLSGLAFPYSRSGFFLAPVVRAWTMTRFS